MCIIHKCILSSISLACLISQAVPTSLHSSILNARRQIDVHDETERGSLARYTRPSYTAREKWVQHSLQNIDTPRTKRKKKFKYILHWTSDLKIEPFNGVHGTKIFSNCSIRNCLVTSDRDHFGFNKVQYFDAVVFNAPDIWYNPSITDNLPEIRYPHQKYVFFSIESSHHYPLCDEEYEYFYNMTWTYKLDSDVVFPYLIIRNSSGTVIGPKKDMHWMKFEDMKPVDYKTKLKLQSKTKAVAWLVSICKTYSKREDFVKQLNAFLLNAGLHVDVYGKCSPNELLCGRPDIMLPDCWETIEMEYYFYLSFENSMSDDYVTEKVLNPLQHYTVPIVFGAANYTRFMPDGAYLDALKLGPYELAQKIITYAWNKEKYYNFFKWRNHYSYHSPFEDPETNPICSFCKKLHRKLWSKTYYRFKDWWNLVGVCPKKPTTTPTVFHWISMAG